MAYDLFTAAFAVMAGGLGVVSVLLGCIALLCIPPRNWLAMAGWGLAALVVAVACLSMAWAGAM